MLVVSERSHVERGYDREEFDDLTQMLFQPVWEPEMLGFERLKSIGLELDRHVALLPPQNICIPDPSIEDRARILRKRFARGTDFVLLGNAVGKAFFGTLGEAAPDGTKVISGGQRFLLMPSPGAHAKYNEPEEIRAMRRQIEAFR